MPLTRECNWWFFLMWASYLFTPFFSLVFLFFYYIKKEKKLFTNWTVSLIIILQNLNIWSHKALLSFNLSMAPKLTIPLMWLWESGLGSRSWLTWFPKPVIIMTNILGLARQQLNIRNWKKKMIIYLKPQIHVWNFLNWISKG